MKYLNFHVLKKFFNHKIIDTRTGTLAAVNASIKSFSTCTKTNKIENILLSENELKPFLSTSKKKAEDVIPEIVSQLEARPYFFKCVDEICEDLKQIFPSANIHLFGSAGSKLALTTSDVDICMIFSGQGEVSKRYLKEVKKQVLRSPAFVCAQPIFARVPIVKCIHHTKLSCDISFSNYIGVVDNKLISFILSIDNRIRQLILILKYLLKKERLLYNTHCLVALTIFFLQKLEDPLIPSIHYLQSLATERQIWDGWDVSFTRNVQHLPSIKNSLSVIELLEKFFLFYSNFEFGLEVISVFTAKSYLKPHFAKTNLLPREFALYKKLAESNFDCSRVMCIQGFFEHSQNISKNYSKEQVRNFQDFCRFNASIGQEVLQKDCSEENKLKFLYDIFGQIRSKCSDRDAKDTSETILMMEQVDLNDTLLSADELRKKWWTQVVNNFMVMLRDVMKSEVVVTSKKPDSVESDSDMVEEKVFFCAVSYCELASLEKETFYKDVLVHPVQLKTSEREKTGTTKLINQSLKNSEIKFEFYIKCTFMKNPTRVLLKFEPKLSDTRKLDASESEIYAFLKRKIIEWVD